MIFHIAWAGWLLYFLVFEGLALFNKTEGDTFSEHVWAWLRGRVQVEPHAISVLKPNEEGKLTVNQFSTRVVDPKIKTNGLSHWTWRTFVVGAFLIWLFLHLTFGWFAG